MIDCSHANSNKDYTKQAFVCRDVAEQIAKGGQLNLITSARLEPVSDVCR